LFNSATFHELFWIQQCNISFIIAKSFVWFFLTQMINRHYFWHKYDTRGKLGISIKMQGHNWFFSINWGVLSWFSIQFLSLSERFHVPFRHHVVTPFHHHTAFSDSPPPSPLHSLHVLQIKLQGERNSEERSADKREICREEWAQRDP